jgi:heme exporter protein A
MGERTYEYIVRMERIRMAYGNVIALNDVSLAVGRDEIVGLIGDNGAGKSTLVAILSTLTRPSAGTVRYGDLETRAHSSDLRAEIGLVAHESFLYGDLTGRENLELYAKLYGLGGARELARAACARAGLSDEAAVRQFRTYSRGMLQRLALARALIHEPQLLLLDEPFTGLDLRAAAALRAQLAGLRTAGRTVLLVTHNIDEGWELATHVAIQVAGRFVQYGPRDTDAAQVRARYAEVTGG